MPKRVAALIFFERNISIDVARRLLVAHAEELRIETESRNGQRDQVLVGEVRSFDTEKEGWPVLYIP